MSKFIFVSFPDEAKAYEGTLSLEALHAEGSLTLYGMAVVAKSQDGRLLVKREIDRGPLGSLNDLANFGVSREFLDNVAKDLTPGKVALVAEVSEEWVTPLNARMSKLGGIVYRTGRSTVEDELSQKELAAAKAELSQLKAEYDHAKAETKATLKARIDEVDVKANSISERLQTRMTDLTQETEAKLKALQAQANRASGDLRATIETRIAELHVDGERRSHQLKEAWVLTKKAFAS